MVACPQEAAQTVQGALIPWGTFPTPTSLQRSPHATSSQEREAGALCVQLEAILPHL